MLAPNFEHHFRFMGLRCRDRITGFVGVGASVCFDVYGCIQTCLTPAHKEGAEKLAASHWFDNNRIEVVSDEQVQPLPDFLTAKPLGGQLPPARDAPGGFDKPAR